MIGTFGQGRTLTTARTPWRLNDESTYYCLEPVSPLTEEELYEQEQQRLHYSSACITLVPATTTLTQATTTFTLRLPVYEQEQLDLHDVPTLLPLINTP